MNYTIEIEENERTLEFALDVECNYWNIPAHTSGAPEDCCEGDTGFDVISVEIELVKLFDEDGISHLIRNDFVFFYLIEDAYKSKIENMLEDNDDLFEAWQKHTQEV